MMNFEFQVIGFDFYGNRTPALEILAFKNLDTNPC